MSGYQTGIIVLLALNTIAAYGVYLPMSAGQLNLGIAGFMAIGAYAAAYLTNACGWPPSAAIGAGGATAAILAFAVAMPMLRTQGIYLSLATFALGQVISAIFLNLDIVGGAAGYPVATHIEASVVVSAATLVVSLVWLMSTTRLTVYFAAVKNDPLVADLLGLNVKALGVAALTVGAGIAGVGGALYAHYFNYIEAQYFGVMLSTYTVLYVLLGGTQSVWGPLVGAAIFTLVPEALRSSSQWRYAIFALFIIVFMALRPQGLLTRGLSRQRTQARAQSGSTNS
ncbi:branched-chain amino acid ABC transporter permease [Bradyrhizobium stylosanthis]|uniref:Amino acid/amide ABC transporter membrane protein 2 (HAAT family) n=1 Tax=Bradyrhizobium stylosanthis TaxID=1803665 RepID=A0A560E2W3_9BRAD|nr:branched-chain amino acid ABC transporter permease [Bradyrhizobium stylosanthis]TWB03660.1 amino acid/amide ABC transporter membrane protein 2 (HAAT family) [Bradyrhizobium stylosanthis]